MVDDEGGRGRCVLSGGTPDGRTARVSDRDSKHHVRFERFMPKRGAGCATLASSVRDAVPLIGDTGLFLAREEFDLMKFDKGIRGWGRVLSAL